MAENQDILSISFDYRKTQEDAARILASLEGVLQKAKELNDFKANITGAVPSFSGAKKAAEDLTKIYKGLEKVLSDYNKSQQQAGADTNKAVSAYDKFKLSVIEAAKEVKNLREELGDESAETIKAAESAEKLRLKLKEIDEISVGKSFEDREKAVLRLAEQQEKSAKNKATTDEAELKRIKALQDAETARAARKAKSDEVNDLVSKNTVKQSELKVETELIRVLQEEQKLSTEVSKTEQQEVKTLIELNKVKQQEIQNELAVIKVLQEEEKVLEQIAKTKTQEAKTVTESQKQITEAQKQATEVAKQAATQKLANAKADTEATKQAEIQAKTAITLTKEQERQAKQAQKDADAAAKAAAKEQKAIDDLGNEYKQLSIAYNEAALKAKNYVLTLGAEHPASVQAVKDAKAMADQLLKVDQSVGQSQRNVGNYPTLLGKVGAGFKSFAVGALQAIGIFAAIDVAVGAIKGIFNLNKELEVSVQNLSAITGAVGSDLKFLKDAAIDLSKNGAASAKDYIEAMKLIGSAKPELLSAKEDLVEVTKAAKLLGEASGLELPDAAARLTDALNQFGEPASRASVYVDALAAAAKFGAAEVPQVTEALVKFGSIAKSSNIDIFESSAAIELLAEKSIKGADAGVALRNVFIKLSAVEVLPKEALAQLKAAGVNTDVLKDKSKSLEDRLKELSKIKNNDNAITKVFGAENLVAGQVILQNIPRFAELTKQIKEQGVALEQSTANTDTIAFKWERLKNVFAAPFIDGGANSKALKTFLTDLTNGIEVFGSGVDRVFSAAGENISAFFKRSKVLLLELKDYATFQFDSGNKREQEYQKEKQITEKRKQDAKDLANTTKSAESVIRSASKEKIEDQKKLLIQNEELLKSSTATYNKLKSEGKTQSNTRTEEGRKALFEFIRDAEIVEGLRKNIAKATAEQIKQEKVVTAETNGGHLGNKVQKIKDERDAVADLRKELSGIQLKQDLGSIAPKEADIQRVKAYDKAFEEIGKRGGNFNAPVVQQLAFELSPINVRVLESQVKELTTRLSENDKLDILPPPETAQKRLDIIRSYVDDEANLYDEVLQRELTIQETASIKEQTALQEQFNQQLINRENYERGLLDIQLKYAQMGATTSIDYLEKEVSLFEAGTKNKEEAEKRLAAARLQISRTVADKQKKHNDEIIDEIKRVQAAFNDVAGVVGSFIDIGVTKQKNALQDLEDQQQKNYQNEVERINNSTLTQQQKADQLKILEAQRQTQKEKFDRETRKADLEKARFDKAAAVANIIFNTAAAVVKALPNVILSIAIGALGAAQLGIALATPLPKFFKGKDKSNKYEGPAWVNDGGKVEPIKRADGSIELNPVAKPLVTFIGKDDIVYPSLEKFIEDHKLIEQKQPIINVPKQNLPTISIGQPEIKNTVNIPEQPFKLTPGFVSMLEKSTNTVLGTTFSVNDFGKLINNLLEVENNKTTEVKKVDARVSAIDNRTSHSNVRSQSDIKNTVAAIKNDIRNDLKTVSNSTIKPVSASSYYFNKTFKPITNSEINNIMHRHMGKQSVQVFNTVAKDGSIVVLHDIKNVLKKINAKERNTNIYIGDKTNWKKYEDAYFHRNV